MSWACHAGGRDPALTSRVTGTPAHLCTSSCSQERNDFGCALLHHPAQGAALDRAHRGASQDGGKPASVSFVLY